MITQIESDGTTAVRFLRWSQCRGGRRIMIFAGRASAGSYRLRRRRRHVSRDVVAIVVARCSPGHSGADS